ncbi:EamA family transporter RarD [Cognatishimia activa]|uniref:Putative chloramphenical resistance permease RarD n=1 Tax=Cognatishimia activa TaxID=1715691 RepID=A0A0P1ILE2_9RHOB|nr:EamA family transporter RarD [Cognatishimia activa]CUI55792.1 putative chloramphenical resistance permease RarD [Cognatishimia activa]CUK24375.1 putative chloramphenical resistance permease RarD [Cognatishimia activa]
MANQDQDTPRGLVLAITAYGLWGFLPLYMKLVDHVPAAEVVAHRVIWSVPIAGAVLLVLRRTKELRQAIKNPRMLAMACVTAALVSVNWGIYVYAISIERAADAALGYYINPLFSMFLAAMLLGERPTKMQMVSILIAAAAVLVLFVAAPAPPWIPLGLTFSWGFYAYCKKSLPIGPNQGFLLEVLILSAPATAYLIYLAASGEGVFLSNARDTWVLLAAGIVTAIPLMIYANGAKLIRLSTAGILQYIAPSMIFILAVFVFNEELDQSRLIAFPMIWTALVIYSVSMIREMRRA